MSNFKIRTKLTELFGIDSPIVLAGMGGVTTPELVGAVSIAGGLGCYGAAVLRKGPEALRGELAEVKRQCKGKPFAVDVLVPGSGEGGVMEIVADIIIESGAKAFVSGLGFPRKEIIEKFHKHGVMVGSVCGMVKHAVRAVETGVDFVIAQGTEAGGHTGQIATSVLVPQIVDAVAGKVPVLAAGGIYDGRGLASALIYGADGVWVGTRFLMTPESRTVSHYKESLLKAESQDTIVTKAYTGRTMRVLRNDYTRYYEQHPEEISSPPSAQTVKSVQAGVIHLGGDLTTPGVDPKKEAYLVGQCVGAIRTLKPAGEIVHEMTQQAGALLNGTNNKNFSIVGAARSKL